MSGYEDGRFDDGIVRREIRRHWQLGTLATRRAYARFRADKLKLETWSPDNEDDRKARIRAYERYANGKLPRHQSGRRQSQAVR